MTSERTKAMDDLIAQDADLIDSPLVERLRWGAWYYEDPFDGKAYASDDPLEAADRIEALEAENERLRADRAAVEAATIAKVVAWLRETARLFSVEIMASEGRKDTSELLHYKQACTLAAEVLEEGWLDQ